MIKHHSGDVINCVATSSITLGPHVTIPDRATFNLTAPRVTINEDVEVLSGSVLAVETSHPSVCVSSHTVVCMGALPVWPAGTLFNQYLDAGMTRVYHFDYDQVFNDIGIFMLFDGQFKVVSVSLSANDFSLAFPCQITQVALQQPVQYAPSGEEQFGECPLEDGKRYYLNIKSTTSTSDSYTLTVR